MLELLNILLAVELGSPEWKENVFASLDIMWKGVLAIFLVIAIVIVVVVCMNKAVAAIQKSKEENEDNKE